MNQALTVGMVVKPLLVVGGLILFIGVIVFILSIFADAFKH
jgi:hypothetical protein